MKRTTKHILVIVFALILLIVTKNVILYFTYNYEIEYLKKDNDQNYYGAEINSYEGGFEMLQDIRINLNNDSGYYRIDTYYYKIDGKVSDEFSFHSLLPFDQDKKESTNYRLRWNDEYIMLINLESDTVYAKYELTDNKLYIDKNKYYTKYNGDPEWGFQFNSRPTFWSILKFW